jgi:ribonucleoside-diphosphate reductase alpha chain
MSTGYVRQRNLSNVVVIPGMPSGGSGITGGSSIASLHERETMVGSAAVAYDRAVAPQPHVHTAVVIDAQREIARMKGYEGESCGECGNFTMVRNGTCLKCDTCGSTSGCS